MAQEDNATRIEEARKLAKEQPQKAEATYKDILTKAPGQNDKALRDFENALTGLGELYRDHRRTQDLVKLIEQTRNVLTSFARAKTAKLGTDAPAASTSPPSLLIPL
jgi:26S proteasome regulatory subunit N6